MTATLGRRYHFSASHRLHAEEMDAAQNREVYGKCNNPHGHGHNYTVEVRFRGDIDPVTGMVLDLAALDHFARQRVLAVYDRANLNCLPAFSSQVPSTEYLAIEMYRIFQGFLEGLLEQVHVEETGKNSFTYSGKEGTS